MKAASIHRLLFLIALATATVSQAGVTAPTDSLTKSTVVFCRENLMAADGEDIKVVIESVQGHYKGRIERMANVFGEINQGTQVIEQLDCEIKVALPKTQDAIHLKTIICEQSKATQDGVLYGLAASRQENGFYRVTTTEQEIPKGSRDGSEVGYLPNPTSTRLGMGTFTCRLNLPVR